MLDIAPLVAVVSLFFVHCSTGRAQVPPPSPIFEGSVPVFYKGLNYPGLGESVNCFRIQTIIKTSTNILLAFSENRTKSCHDHAGEHAIVARRSLVHGLTWGPLIQVAKDLKPPCPNCPKVPSNPNSVEISTADGRRAILIHYDTMNSPEHLPGLNHGLDMQKISFDDGQTWSAPEPLTFVGPFKENNCGALIGPSNGIFNKRTSRIYFSAHMGAKSGGFLYFSKDDRKTWQMSRTVKGMNECSIAFLNPRDPSDVLMNCRTGAEKGRAQLIFSEDGALKNISYPPGLHNDPGCQGSVVSDAFRENVLYASNANDQTARQNMTVKITKDSARTWDVYRHIYSGPSGYSQLVQLNKTHMGLLFECGLDSDPKTFKQTISFVTFKI